MVVCLVVELLVTTIIGTLAGTRRLLPFKGCYVTDGMRSLKLGSDGQNNNNEGRWHESTGVVVVVVVTVFINLQ